MTERIILCLAILLLWPATALDSQTLEWDQVYGTSGNERAYAVVTAPDSSLYFIGYYTENGADSKDLLLTKADREGVFAWSQTYGGSDIDWGRDIIVTSDSNLVLVGYSSSFTPSSQLYILKVDLEGAIVWARIYGGPAEDYGYSVVETHDGGFIVAGYTSSFGEGSSDVYLTKISSDGIQVWTKFYGGAGADWARDIKPTADSNFIVTGWTNSFGSGNYDVYLLKTAPDGDTIWTNVHGGTNTDAGEAVIETPTGEFVVAGLGYRGFLRGFDAFLVGFSSLGEFQWEKDIGGLGDEELRDLIYLPNGTLVGIGTTSSTDFGDDNLLYLEVDGDSILSTDFGGSLTEESFGVCWPDDEGLILAGYSNSFGSEDQVYAVRVNHDFVCGDMDGNGSLNVSDAVYLIAYIFGSGAGPFPRKSGDYDCSGSVNLSDAVSLIAWTFGQGGPPCDTCEPAN